MDHLLSKEKVARRKARSEQYKFGPTFSSSARRMSLLFRFEGSDPFARCSLKTGYYITCSFRPPREGRADNEKL